MIEINSSSIVKNCYQYRRLNSSKHFRRRFNRVYKMCCDYLATKINADNCIDMTLFAEKHQFHRLTQSALKYIDEHFEWVFTSDDYLELPIIDLLKLIPLLIYNEMCKTDVVNATWLWINYRRPIRKPFKRSLLKY